MEEKKFFFELTKGEFKVLVCLVLRITLGTVGAIYGTIKLLDALHSGDGVAILTASGIIIVSLMLRETVMVGRMWKYLLSFALLSFIFFVSSIGQAVINCINEDAINYQKVGNYFLIMVIGTIIFILVGVLEEILEARMEKKNKTSAH